MASLFSRLGFNFNTAKFGEASTLSEGANNTVNLISSSFPTFADWQKSDLSAGSPARTTYFQNPYTANFSSMNTSITSIKVSANTCNLSNIVTSSNNFTLEIGAFHSHTNNLSGIVVVTDPSIPSYDTASGIGQMSMMNLVRVDGPQTNTTPILGSFTSLFVRDDISSNVSQLIYYSGELANSIVAIAGVDANGDPITTYSSNLSSGELTNIVNYIDTTRGIMNTRRTHDWNFFQNSIQITKDVAFISQFNNLGNTNKYLINNVIGTNYLVTNLANTA
jgi:hypothetical protein